MWVAGIYLFGWLAGALAVHYHLKAFLSLLSVYLLEAKIFVSGNKL